MIRIVHKSKTVAKFERFEGNKAMDYITYKGRYIENRMYIDDDIIWVVKDL